VFIADFHPDVRARAAAEFDQAYVGVTDIRSDVSNLDIDLPDANRASVTFDVDLRFVVRADGRELQDSYEEHWDLVREGNRWWILEWN
jgi:hypothetical protein